MQVQLSNVDWKLLREQKAVLVDLWVSNDDEEECEALLGVINLIDNIQDEAAMAVDPEMIYGPPEVSDV